ncbi:MAG: sulfite oxidase [Chloroflexi bacterium]|nr:sulfite oxidase [Chloroflexota bacterium]
MSLYVVRHHHEAENCPAHDPEMGAMLLQHLSQSNASEHGITIHGEAVIDGAHTLYVILDAAERSTVDGFMAPFAQAGEVEVLPASPCEVVVARLGCD